MDESKPKVYLDVARGLTRQRGRGALSNRHGRFESCSHELYDDGWETLGETLGPSRTTVHTDRSCTVINRNDSPDIPFSQSLNPYRGCEHGCIYCYARPSHAYLGFSPGLDFETQIVVKPDAAKLLRTELSKPGYRASPIALGSNTDPYQPLERRLKIMRSILEVLAEFRHPLSIVTKSSLIERDLDVLSDLAQDGLVQAFVSITTLKSSLARKMEPRAAAPHRRLQTVEALAAARIPVGVLTAPLIPVVNDSEMETILEQASNRGARWAGYVLLRLPYELKDLFQEWLEVHEPLKAQHVMSLIRQSRGGRENDPRFGARMQGRGIFAETIARRFRLACARLGLNAQPHELNEGAFRAPPRQHEQLSLI
jgi:DNA repair photolyase